MNEGTGSSAEEIAHLQAELARCQGLELRAREVIEAAPDALVLVDRAGRIVLVNVKTEQLFGYKRDEMLGQPMEMLMPERARSSHVAKRDRFIAAPTQRPLGMGLNLVGRRRDGTEVPVDISLSPLHTSDGEFVAAAIRDVSDRREAQEALRRASDELELRVRERTGELEQANKALQAEMADRNKAEQALLQAQKMEAVGQLTGGVAHDFNNLLMVVMGNLQILAQHLEADAFAIELIQAALTAAGRGADLNRRLLAFSRKQRLAPVPVDFNAMIAGLVGMLRRILGEQVQIVVHGPMRNLPRAIADAAQLEAALLNLAINARDAMPQGGTLTIEASAVSFTEHDAALEGDVRPGRYVMLSVSDTGSGMSPEVVRRAFEPFFTTKEPGKGTGLGLAMVYGFVKQSGGHVRITSELGVGTTVRVYLPEIKQTGDVAARDATGEQVERAAGRETILVVEDEPDVRDLACRTLRGLGYHVLEAADGGSALAVIEREPGIDLLFSDVVLPGGTTGPDIAAIATQRRPGLKVLFTSGYTGNAIRQVEAPENGIPLISKPYTIKELARTVRASLDARGHTSDGGAQ